MAFNSNYRQPMSYGGNSGYQGGISSEVAPPIPPRNYNQNIGNAYGGQSMYSNFGSGYGGIGYGGGYGSYGGGYGGFGGSYGSYGGFGGGYGGYNSGYGSYGGYRPGFGGTPENRFIQVAEEGARPAFESFHAIIEMLQSVTMVFDSTFRAAYASYASVFGVVDNFSRLRSMLGRAFSAMSIVKVLQWFYKLLMYRIGLSRTNPSLETAWTEAASAGAAVAPYNWLPITLFALVLSGSYLVTRLISQMSPPQPTLGTWNPEAQPGTRADVLYSFQAGNASELSIRRSQVLMVAPKQYQPTNTDWILVCDQSKQMGMIPANFVSMNSNAKSMPPKPKVASQNYNGTPQSNPMESLNNITPFTNVPVSSSSTDLPSTTDTTSSTSAEPKSSTLTTNVLPVANESSISNSVCTENVLSSAAE